MKTGYKLPKNQRSKRRQSRYVKQDRILNRQSTKQQRKKNKEIEDV